MNPSSWRSRGSDPYPSTIRCIRAYLLNELVYWGHCAPPLGPGGDKPPPIHFQTELYTSSPAMQVFWGGFLGKGSALLKGTPFPRIWPRLRALLVVQHHHRSRGGQGGLGEPYSSAVGALHRLAYQEVINPNPGPGGAHLGGLVMHGDDHLGVKLAHHLGGPGRVYGVEPSHGYHQHVYRAHGLDYLRGQELAEVTKVGQAQAVHLQDKDGVAAPLAPPSIIVIDGNGRGNTVDADVLHPLVYGIPACGAEAPQYQGTARGHGHIIMVRVLVGDEDSIHAGNGSYRIAYRGTGRVYDDFSPLGRDKGETSLAQPL